MFNTVRMTLLVIGVVLIILAITAGIRWYASGGRAVAQGGCNPPLPRQTIHVGSSTFDVEMATTPTEQACGLSGRDGLADGTGMLFIFGSSSMQNFWMKDMKFPIDIVWISGNKIVGAAQNADPQIGASIWQLKIYTSPFGVDKVLELPAGTVASRGIKNGDTVSRF